jgi:sulfite exporter TauE/SafE
VRQGLRLLSALALLLGAFVAFGRVRDPGSRLTHGLWSKLAPLGRRLLPVHTLPRAFAFGMIWGWMPCGFVYTVLLIAALQLDAVTAGATMAAFGLGTLPAMFATTFGAQRVVALAARPGGKRVAGALLFASATLTLIGPWLAIRMPWLHAWLPFECAFPQ